MTWRSGWHWAWAIWARTAWSGEGASARAAAGVAASRCMVKYHGQVVVVRMPAAGACCVAPRGADSYNGHPALAQEWDGKVAELDWKLALQAAPEGPSVVLGRPGPLAWSGERARGLGLRCGPGLRERQAACGEAAGRGQAFSVLACPCRCAPRGQTPCFYGKHAAPIPECRCVVF